MVPIKSALRTAAPVREMDTRILEWNWRGKTIRLGADASGTGPKVLLLPALSSISTRREMQALQQRLAPRYSTLAVDWPGFGDGARPTPTPPSSLFS